MAPPPSSSSAMLAVLVVLVLLGMGCPAEARTSCKVCALQCNSTCSAVNFTAGPCAADCIPEPSCVESCVAALLPKCKKDCFYIGAIKHEHQCQSECSQRLASFCYSRCASNSPPCMSCKDNYSRACKSCCTAYCKGQCVV